MVEQKKERSLTKWRKAIIKVYGAKMWLYIKSCERLEDWWNFVGETKNGLTITGKCNLNLDCE